LHDTSVITTNGEESLLLGVESDSNNVLGVSLPAGGIGTRLVDGVTVEVDLTLVITGRDNSTIRGSVDTINEITRSTGREDTLSGPRDLGSVLSPLNILIVRSTTWVLSGSTHVVEEDFVGVIDDLDVLTIFGEIDGKNGSRVTSQGGELIVVVLAIVEVKGLGVITGTHVFTIRREGNNLAPFLGVGELLDDVHGVDALSDLDGTIIDGNSDVTSLGVDGNSSRLLIRREGGQRRGTTNSSEFASLLVNDGSRNGSSGFGVPAIDLIIVSGSEQSVGLLIIEAAPDLTIGVRFHNGLVGSVNSLNDVTISQTEKDLVTLNIDSSRVSRELNGLLLGFQRSIKDDALSVTTNVDTRVNGRDTIDHSLADLGLTGAVLSLPREDSTLERTGVASTVRAISDTSHGVSGVGTEDTARLIQISVEIEQSKTSLGGTSKGVLLRVPAQVDHRVRATLHLSLLVTSGGVKNGNSVIVVITQSGNKGTVVIPANSFGASGVSGLLTSGNELTSLGIPNEDSGLLSDLTSGDSLSIGGQSESRDIIVMLLAVGSNITTEEFLGVVVLVQDDTESGSHVNGITVGIVEQVVSGVNGSVTVDVLQSKLLGRGVGVESGGITGGNHSTLPGLGGHELLTFTLLLDFETIILSVVLISGVTRLVESLIFGVITLGVEVISTFGIVIGGLFTTASTLITSFN